MPVASILHGSDQAFVPVENWQQRHQRVPKHAISQSADHLEKAAKHSTPDHRIGKEAHPSLCLVDSQDQGVQRHAALALATACCGNCTTFW